jgi:hypothetical protein
MTERAKTAQEYVDLVDQVIFDLEELQASTAYDIDDVEGIPAYLDVLL